MEHRHDFGPTVVPRQRRESRIAQLAQQRLLDLVSPNAVLVDRDGHIVYTCGDVDRYLTHRPGVPSDDLLDKSRPDLRSILRAADSHSAL